MRHQKNIHIYRGPRTCGSLFSDDLQGCNCIGFRVFVLCSLGNPLTHLSYLYTPAIYNQKLLYATRFASGSKPVLQPLQLTWLSWPSWVSVGAGAPWGWGWQGRAVGLGKGLELGWDFSHTFKENSKLMKMQFKAKFTQFLFILLLRV